MPNIPASTLYGFFGVLSVLFGVFLLLAGTGVISVGPVVVNKGRVTIGIGVLFVVVGVVLVAVDTRTSAEVSHVSAIATSTQTVTVVTPSDLTSLPVAEATSIGAEGAVALPEPTPKSVELWQADGPFHLGDEDLSDIGYEPLVGPCKDVEIDIPELATSVTMNVQTYGAEVENLVKLNGRTVGLLARREPREAGQRPHYWTEFYDVTIAGPFVTGLNSLSICAGLLTDHPVDLDDFQVKIGQVLANF